MKNIKIPELLSPAGGWTQLKAAVQNGADAVYIGGPLFNARIKAENFGKDDMERAICYAHDRNVRIYVTVNTLIKDNELEKAFSYVNFLYGAGADAVILQDMGLARLVRKYLPDMDMHLSTQGTLYNKQAVGSVKEMGFCRVVAAREMTLAELTGLSGECHSGEKTCQLEAFIHGALCICYSGQCQMSRILGGERGRSGNRGVCAQPCRLPYRDENGMERFLLSPKDICTIDMIPELCRAGIDSLKIEGRLKSPQYVAVVTSVYRKYLDMYRDTGIASVSEEDKRKLLSIFNRGGFGTGYFDGNPGEELLSGSIPKNQGIYIGKIAAVKKGSTLVDVRTNGQEIIIGDGVEIHGREVNGNVISYMKPLGSGIVRIGDMKGKISAGDEVYRVTDRRLMSEAEKSYSSDFMRKTMVNMKFKAEVGAVPELILSEPVQPGEMSPENIVSIKGNMVVEKALKKTLEAERVKRQLSKLGETVFEAGNVDVELGRDVSLPVSVINMMRRDAVEVLLDIKRKPYRMREPLNKKTVRNICAKELNCGGNETYKAMKESVGVHIYSTDGLRAIEDEIIRASGRGEVYLYVPLELYMKDEIRRRLLNNYGSCGIVIIPYILNISKGRLDRYIEENFNEITERVRGIGIMVCGLGWIERFRSEGIKIYGGYGLNAYNRQSIKAYSEIGVEIMEYSHEDSEHCFGNLPIMITEHPVTSERFTDRKGKRYRVMTWYSGDKYLIFKETKQDGIITINGVVNYIL